MTTEQQKTLARAVIRQAVYRGKVTKENCNNCGSSNFVQGHHYDGHNDPYKVKWLCVKCHRKEHFKNHPSKTTMKEVLKALRKQKKRNISALARQFKCSRAYIYKLIKQND